MIYPGRDVYPPNPGSVVLTVAAANTPSKLKHRADFICDGTSATGGDEAEINMALSMADTVVLCPGTYWLSGSIQLGDNQTLQGSGPATVLKLKDNYNADIDLIIVSSKSRVTIANLTVDGNKANQTEYPYQVGIYFDNTTNSKIESCHIMNMMGEGIYLYSSNNNTITGNICRGNFGYGIYLEECNNNMIVGNMCWENAYDGISLYMSCNNNMIVGNMCWENAHDGIHLSHSCNNNIISGNMCRENARGIDMYLYCSNNVISENVCYRNKGHGIGLRYSCHSNKIIGNICLENSTALRNAFDNIFLYDNCNYNLIAGNICRHNNVSHYGINISSSNCSYNMVEGNNLYASGLTGDLNDAGTNTRKRDNLGNTGEWLTDV